jgi:hypothetical protein
MVAPGGMSSISGDLDMKSYQITNLATQPVGNNSTMAATTAFVAANTATVPKITTFAASGTWTPDPKMLHGYMQAKGGGGGGGGSVINTSLITVDCGGGEGCTAIKWFRKSAITLPTYAVTVGLGGTGGNGTGGGNGGDSIVAGLVTAKGGIGGNQYSPGHGQVAGSIGDIVIYGEPGEVGSSCPAVTSAPAGTGGGGGGSGGGPGQMNGSGGSYTNGNPGSANSGGGGGGATGYATGPGNIIGGAGGSGIVYIVEYCTP